jgi:hypothetical protein
MTTKQSSVLSGSVDTITSSGTLSLGTSVAGTVNIGRSGGTVINLNAPLVTVSSSTNITLKTNGTAPTEQTQLGGKSSATVLATTPVNGSVYGTITITQAGVYILSFGVYQSISSLGTTNYVTLTGAGTTAIKYGATNILTGALPDIGFNGSQIVTCTASSYTIVLTTNSTCSGAGGILFTATRIG